MLYFNLISFFLIVVGAAALGLQTPDIAASARVYPLILIVLVVACSLIIAAKEIAGRAATAPLDPRFAKILAAPRDFRLRVLGFTATWVVYAGTLSWIGFIAATTGAIALSLWILRTRKMLSGVLAAALFSAVLSVLLATVLYIPTPQGPLDRLLTEAIFALQQ